MRLGPLRAFGLSLSLGLLCQPVTAGDVTVSQGVGAGGDIIVEEGGKIIIGLQAGEVLQLIERVRERLQGDQERSREDSGRLEAMEAEIQAVRTAIEKVLEHIGDQRQGDDDLTSRVVDLATERLVVSERLDAISADDDPRVVAIASQAGEAIEAGDYRRADEILKQIERCGFSKFGDFVCTTPEVSVSRTTVASAVLSSMLNERSIFYWSMYEKIAISDRYDILGIKLGSSLNEAKNLLLDYFENNGGIRANSFFIHPYFLTVPKERDPRKRIFQLGGGLDEPTIHLNSGFLFSFEFEDHGEHVALFATEETDYKVFAVFRVIDYPEGGPNTVEIADALMQKYGPTTNRLRKPWRGGYLVWSDAPFSGAQSSLGCGRLSFDTYPRYRWVNTQSYSPQSVKSGVFFLNFPFSLRDCGSWLAARVSADSYSRTSKIMIGTVDSDASRKIVDFHTKRLSEEAMEPSTKF